MTGKQYEFTAEKQTTKQRHKTETLYTGYSLWKHSFTSSFEEDQNFKIFIVDGLSCSHLFTYKTCTCSISLWHQLVHIWPDIDRNSSSIWRFVSSNSPLSRLVPSSLCTFEFFWRSIVANVQLFVSFSHLLILFYEKCYTKLNLLTE